MRELRRARPDDAATAPGLLALAPGAQGGMDSPWLAGFAGLLAERGIRTVRFEFGYGTARRAGVRRPVPRAEASMPEYRQVVAELVESAGGPVVIGGKSYGGRVASMIADAEHDAGRVLGLVCLGYPFHPPGRPDRLRTAHLTALRTPALICQGERDPFGGAGELPGFGMSSAVRTLVLPDGDHDLRPRVASGRTAAGNLAQAADAVAAFVRACYSRPASSRPPTSASPSA